MRNMFKLLVIVVYYIINTRFSYYIYSFLVYTSNIKTKNYDQNIISKNEENKTIKFVMNTT